MPVLPPTAESTCDNNVVGIWIKLIPLNVILAAKPTISPITPPPRAIKVSFLSTLYLRSLDVIELIVLIFLYRSPSLIIILLKLILFF